VAQRSAEAQPLERGGTEADDVVISVTLILSSAAAVASSAWFADQSIYQAIIPQGSHRMRATTATIAISDTP
jgi:hypothetical protein